MAMMTVRNIPDEVHRALRVRAAIHGRSAEAEVRAILEESVKAEGRIKLGSMLAEIGRQSKLTDEEFTAIEQIRDKTPANPMNFK
ncbi:FitA-like ribbon-helix-helix domain-containing protein [Photorhabdus aegyptia]|uniref:FitA-like ribbon-helix-helix domain-containing protein n=1 Tax=Photorhabdus aegyptia TaxID=2805098 RepID=UPI0006203A16|nr:Arc family DNA-binding protein [Photorhabdus aegyptia]MCC8456549.1 Arc family DNA-binding protein [Photorhabdus aegyptia]